MTPRADAHISSARRWLAQKLPVESAPVSVSLTRLDWVLIGVLLLAYVLIRLPIYDQGFGIAHMMKYGNNVGTALHMAEVNNPFVFEKKHWADPTSGNVHTEWTTLSFIPALDWLLYGAFELFPSVPLQTSTHIVLYTLSFILLILFYRVVRIGYGVLTALLATALLSFNSVFIHSSALPIYDPAAIICTLLCLLRVVPYGTERNAVSSSNLAQAGLYAGLAVLFKMTALLWCAPMLLVLLWTRQFSSYTARLITVGVYASLPIAVFSVSLRYLPVAPVHSLSSLVAASLLSYGLYRIHARVHTSALRLCTTWSARKMLLMGALSAAVGSVALVFFAQDILEKAPLYFSDPQLLLDPHLYRLLFVQFVQYVGIPTTILVVFALALIPLEPLRDRCRMIRASLAGVVVYTLVASTAIMIHNYYMLSIMLATSLLIAVLMTYAYAYLPKKFSILGLSALLLFAGFFSHSHVKSIVSAEVHGIPEASAHLSEHMAPNAYYVSNTNGSVLSAMSRRSMLLDLTVPYNEQLRLGVSQVGFRRAMEIYNVTHIVELSQNHSAHPPEVSVATVLYFANLFSPQNLLEYSDVKYMLWSMNRSLVQGSYRPVGYRDAEEALRVLRASGIENDIVFEAAYGNFNIFRILRPGE